MKKILYTVLACTWLASCADANKEGTETMATDTDTTAAASAPSTPPPPPMDSAAMMKAWEAYMTPGDMHKMIASWDGTWSGEVTSWMDPAKPPMQSTSQAKNKMILGGRYQESVHTGNFGGMPFEGRSVVGYDNATKKFVSSWVDNMGTGIMHLEGTWDEASKTITFTGDCVDPSSGTQMGVREVYTIVDDTHHTMTMYMTPKGAQEFKSMEIKMTKKS